MFRVIIAGSRGFDDYELLKEKMDYYLYDKVMSGEQVSIVSGHARGADELGEQYAEDCQLFLTVYPADWAHLGKKAGYIRNGVMAKNADALVAFWDGESRGTLHMIKTAKRKGLPVRVVLYKEENKTLANAGKSSQSSES